MHWLSRVRASEQAAEAPVPLTPASPQAPVGPVGPSREELETRYAEEWDRRKTRFLDGLIFGAGLMLLPVTVALVWLGLMQSRDTSLTDRWDRVETSFAHAKVVGEPFGPAVGLLAIAAALALTVTVGTSRELEVLPTTTRGIRAWYSHLVLTHCARWICFISASVLFLGVPAQAFGGVAGAVGALVWILAAVACLGLFAAIPDPMNAILARKTAYKQISAIAAAREAIVEAGGQESPPRTPVWKDIARIHSGAAALDFALIGIIALPAYWIARGNGDTFCLFIVAVAGTCILLTIMYTPLRLMAVSIAIDTPSPAFSNTGKRRTERVVLMSFIVALVYYIFCRAPVVDPSTDLIRKVLIATTLVLSPVATGLLLRWLSRPMKRFPSHLQRALLRVRLHRLAEREAGPRWVLEQWQIYELDGPAQDAQLGPAGTDVHSRTSRQPPVR